MAITKTYSAWVADLIFEGTTGMWLAPRSSRLVLDFIFKDDTLGDAEFNETFDTATGFTLTYQGTATVDGVPGFYAALGTPAGVDFYFITESTRTDLANNVMYFTKDTFGPGGADFVVCFFPGTLIATPAGHSAVEDLCIGDEVLTHDGRAAPVRWVGRQTVSTRFADPLRTLPVRIRAGALGDGLPKRDLLVSPAHALLVDGILVQAGALVNGTSITREHEAPDIFTYHHVELDSHALLLAEGTPAESFVDHVVRAPFDNRAERDALGRGRIAEMDLPRATSARQVPPATRRRLDAIARDLGLPAVAAA